MDKQADNFSKGENLTRHQHLLKEYREQVQIFLSTQLSEMFEQIEPALVDFANMAETNSAQTRFFDTINIIRNQRKAVEECFKEEIARGFDEFSRMTHISYPIPLIETDDEQHLDMVDNDVLEEHLAIQNMISKSQNSCYKELYSLGQRLSMVRGGKKLVEEDIPACPAHLATSFQIAAKKLELEKDLLLITYFMFGKFVLDEVKPTYQGVNDLLIEAGIFPNLTLKGLKSPETREPTAEKTAAITPPEPLPADAMVPLNQPNADTAPVENGREGASAEISHEQQVALGEEMFQSIHSLLTARRQSTPEYQNHPEYAANGDRSTLAGTPELLTAIDSLQPVSSTELLPAIANDGGQPQSIELDPDLIEHVRVTLIAERQKLFQELDKNKIPTADLDTIDLVGMLFEEVLNEEELSNIAKALISHLHTPYLKVAIIDHSFLIDHRHIARQLLDLMISAGCDWIDEDDLRRGIYYPMQESVNLILSTFQKDLDIFEEQYEALSKQMDLLEQRAKLVEERNLEAAKGRERLENARARAREIIEIRCLKHTLHPVQERFLTHAWLDRMILMLLRDPEAEKSNEWADILKVVDAVIRAGDAKNNLRIKAWLKSVLPNLKRRIDAGLSSLGDYHQPDTDALFKLMISYIKATPGTETEKSTQATEAARHEVPEPGTEEKKAPALSEKEKNMLSILKDVKFGTWFELMDDKQVKRHLKLSWYSPVTNKYMFVDRFGIQAFITPIDSLAQQMCEGTANIVTQQEVPFMNRALKKIHTLLEKTFGFTKST